MVRLLSSIALAAILTILPPKAMGVEFLSHEYAATVSFNTITIRNHEGGAILRVAEDFEAKVERYQIILDGDCWSACMILSSLPRDRVCATEGSMIHMHRPSRHGTPLPDSRVLYPYISDEMRDFIVVNTLPEKGWLTVEATAFLAPCVKSRFFGDLIK